MGTLEQIGKMRQQGMSDSEITESLRGQGVTPKEISDSLNQSNIKSAVSGEYSQPEDLGEEDYSLPPKPNSNQYQPATQEIGDNSQTYAPQQYQEYYPQQAYGSTAGYGTETASYSQTDSMMDIAEQVFQENTKKMQKQIENLEQFKNISVIQLQNISDRLKRMEFMFDKLQIAVVERVGSYGKELSSLKKEVSMVEDSFSKVANEKIGSYSPPAKKTRRKSTRKKKK